MAEAAHEQGRRWAGGKRVAGWRRSLARLGDGLRRLDAGYAPHAAWRAPRVRLEGLAAGYGGEPAIEGVSGEFPAGSLTAVLGPNGAGKSTLLKVIAGLLQPLAGSVERGGASASDIAYLPQVADIDRSFPVSVTEFVALGAWRRFGAFRPAAVDTDAALEAVGLADIAEHPIEALSAGQLRRALFARLMLQDAGLLLLDEPFAAVDETTSAVLLDLLARSREEGRTIIVVLHDLAQVRRLAPRTLVLSGGASAWSDKLDALPPIGSVS